MAGSYTHSDVVPERASTSTAAVDDLTAHLASLAVDGPAGQPAEHPSTAVLASTSQQLLPPSTTRRVGFIYDAVMELHIAPEDHFERPMRTATLDAKMRLEGLLDRCIQLPSRQATDEELLRAHSPGHIRYVDTHFPDIVSQQAQQLIADAAAAAAAAAAVPLPVASVAPTADLDGTAGAAVHEIPSSNGVAPNVSPSNPFVAAATSSHPAATASPTSPTPAPPGPQKAAPSTTAAVPASTSSVSASAATADAAAAGASALGTQLLKLQNEIHEEGDNYWSRGTAAAARFAAGCVTEAVLQVATGKLHSALANVRPPGHHAECARAMGFCFYNNVVVAARAALQVPGVNRVLVLDWDVHHGNGIQHILEEDANIMYVSLHRFSPGFYPGTGDADEVGTGPGLGYTVNVGWPKPGVGDADYMAAFDTTILPIATSFKPDLVIVAAGFDAALGDPLGRCEVSEAGYAHMTTRLMGLAGGKIVLALEGGYNVRMTADCAAACVKVLLGAPPPPMSGPKPLPSTQEVLQKVYDIHQAHWTVFAERSFKQRWADAEVAWAPFLLQPPPAMPPIVKHGTRFNSRKLTAAAAAAAADAAAIDAAAKAATESGVPAVTAHIAITNVSTM